MRLRHLACSILVGIAAVVVACGGGSDEDKTPEATGPTAQPVATSADATGEGGNGGAGRTFTEAEATALLDSVLLKPADLTGQWVIESDEVTDNEAAASAPGGDAALIERCGRLTGRTIVNSPEDTISAFLAGEALSFFSNATVYATVEGARECSAESARTMQEPGALARTFGSIFLDPDAVEIGLVDYPAIGDGSFAVTLTGETDASGMTFSLTLFVVGFSKGNVSAAIGSARAGAAPPVDELSPLVDLVLDRITSGQ
jgi:hypothetical protein